MAKYPQKLVGARLFESFPQETLSHYEKHLADKLSPARRSANMARIRSRDTKPEMVVRRLLHAMGYRYRLHRRDLPGNPDLVFSGRRKVVFVHGCFWHQHEDPSCLDGRPPKSNASYWAPKLQRNVERDRQAAISLMAEGWDALIVWECEVRDRKALSEKLRTFLDPGE